MPRKKSRTNDPAPIIMVNAMKSRYKDIFDLIDASVKHLKATRDDVQWDDRCYFPSFFVDTLSDYLRKNENINFKQQECGILTQLAAWRQYKQIFSIDGDFADVLFESATDEIVLYDLLYALPYNSFYVEFNGESALKSDGFFFTFDMLGDDDPVVSLMNVEHDMSVTSMIVHIKPNFTVKDSLNEIKRLCKLGNVEMDKKSFDILSDFVQKALQIVIYLCTVNADVNENENQKKYMRRPSAKSLEKDVTREVQKWDVGYRIGSSLRASKASTNSVSISHSGSHTPKRPHSRRGHFHRFWTGSEKDGSRKLVVKWITPMFIHGNDSDTAVIRKIN